MMAELIDITRQVAIAALVLLGIGLLVGGGSSALELVALR